jgi:hypothetical protein
LNRSKFTTREGLVMLFGWTGNHDLSSLLNCALLHHTFQCHSTQDSDVDVDHTVRDTDNVYRLGIVA